MYDIISMPYALSIDARGLGGDAKRPTVRTPVAAPIALSWVVRLVLMASGVILGCLLGAGPAQADSPPDLGKTVDKVATTVHEATSPGRKSAPSAGAVKTSKSVHKAARQSPPTATSAPRAATKVVRHATKSVHTVTKPSRKVIHTARRASRPAAKPVRKIGKSVQQVTRSAEQATQRDRQKSRRAKPEAVPTGSDVAATAKPTATTMSAVTTRSTARPSHSLATQADPAIDAPSTANPPTATSPVIGTVQRVQASVGNVTSSTMSLLILKHAVVDGATQVLRAAGPQHADPIPGVSTEDVLTPVDTIHDSALELADHTLTITAPSVVQAVTALLVPVVDQVGGVLPSEPTLPGSPTAPGGVLVPGHRPGLDQPALDAADSALTSAPRSSRPSAAEVAGASGPLVGSALLGAALTATTAIEGAGDLRPAQAVAAELVLAGTAGPMRDGLTGTGSPGSAAALTLGLTLLALASASPFGAGNGRSLGVAGLLDRGPYRRTQRPGFSPD